MSEFIKERVKSLISESEMEEETEKRSFYYLIRKLTNADFLNNLDIVNIKYALQNEGKMNENRKALFDRLMISGEYI